MTGRETSSTTVYEAGAIALRRVRGALCCLLVTSSKSNEWIFPKGHIEPEEAAEQAALRELAEEAGVEGRLLAPAGQISFAYNGQNVQVEYFFVEALGDVAPEDDRQTLWLPLDEAISTLTFENSRDLLASNRTRIDTLLP